MNKSISYLGAGTWGISLASILARKGHEVIVWARSQAHALHLQTTKRHPKLGDFEIPSSIRFTSNLQEALEGAEILVESVTSQGIRPVFQEIVQRQKLTIPIILTSKGIEQGTGLLLPQVLCELLREEKSWQVGCLSGPSHAEEVVQKLPTSVVCSAYDASFMHEIHSLFVTPTFRIYPNGDLHGVCFGGAMKNVIAIACGIADGLGCGDNAKAALMTRGLHEMRKLCVVKDCDPQTLNGLSGLGDLCVTCLSHHSRNYRLGRLVAEGFSPKMAKEKIGMAVEGMYSCVSACQLGHQHHIPVPIAEVTRQILYDGLDPKEGVSSLLTRTIKEEHL